MRRDFDNGVFGTLREASNSKAEDAFVFAHGTSAVGSPGSCMELRNVVMQHRSTFDHMESHVVDDDVSYEYISEL